LDLFESVDRGVLYFQAIRGGGMGDWVVNVIDFLLQA